MSRKLLELNVRYRFGLGLGVWLSKGLGLGLCLGLVSSHGLGLWPTNMRNSLSIRLRLEKEVHWMSKKVS